MVSGGNDEEINFNVVQHGDAEMSQKLYRLVRVCIELGDENPIMSIHDQGVGGNCNVMKEIIYPKGAEIDIREIVVGDHTMSVLEIWGVEYQEQDAILVKPESHKLLKSNFKRERVSMVVIGTISGDGRVVLVDSLATQECLSNGLPPPPPPAVDIELKKIPLADVAVTAHTFTDITGGACAIGEQPIKGLLDRKAMARLAVAEVLTNLVWAKVTLLSDVKASGNWMYTAKLDRGGAAMYDAVISLSEEMFDLGIAIDEGKDNLVYAAQFNNRFHKSSNITSLCLSNNRQKNLKKRVHDRNQ
ncbi:hypothetical protein RYX36_021813 [Vicia faba]